MPRAASTGCSNECSATTRSSKRSASTNFAPVVRCVDESRQLHLRARLFGQDAQTTADYISSAVPVYAQSGIACVLKHFPGYGNNADTHTGIALDARPYTTFEKSDLVPFESGIAAGAPFVLVSHNIECMDGAYPASLSAKVHTLLRDTLGFTGVIVMDDLAMDAVKAYACGRAAPPCWPFRRATT